MGPGSGDIVGSIRRSGIHVLLLVALLMAPLMFQGIDLTDHGWHLTNQAESVKPGGSFEDIEWLFPLSQYLAGTWLGLAGRPSVVWARFGGLLIISVNSMLVYSLLRRRFPGERILPPVLATALVIVGLSRSLRFEYFTIPSLLLVAQLWLLDRALKGWDSKSARIWAFLLGALYVPVSLGRLPLTLTALIPVAWLLYLRHRGADTTKIRRVIAFSLLGIAVAASIAVATLALSGSMGPMLKGVSGAFVGGGSLPEHETGYMLQRYVSDAVRAALYTALFVVLAVLVTRMVEKRGARQSAGLVILCLLALGAVLLVTRPDPFSIRWWRHGSILMLGLLSLAFLVVLHFDKGEDLSLDLLLLSGGLVMLINPLGSNTGLHKSFYGMWVIFPLVYLRLRAMGASIPCRWVRAVSLNLAWGLLAMLAFSSFLVWIGIYRDNPNRLTLTTPFFHPSLRGIHSTESRVRAIENVLEVIENQTNPGDRVLIVNSVPILYFLTETTPLLGEPWAFLEDLQFIREAHEQFEGEDAWPLLFCANKGNSRDWRWPTADGGIDPTDEEKLSYLLDLYSRKADYRLVFDDNVFSIYVRSPDGNPN